MKDKDWSVDWLERGKDFKETQIMRGMYLIPLGCCSWFIPRTFHRDFQ